MANNLLLQSLLAQWQVKPLSAVSDMDLHILPPVTSMFESGLKAGSHPKVNSINVPDTEIQNKFLHNSSKVGNMKLNFENYL